MHRIRKVLEEKGLTQADLARRLETTPANVSRKLAGRREITLDELFDYAQALGVPAFTLIAGSERARELTKEQEAILAAFNALDREGQLAMLAEFANRAFDPRTRQDRRSQARHGLPKH